MTDYSELAKRLRSTCMWTRHEIDGFRSDGDPFEAADALEAQAREIAELKEVLKPFIAMEKPFLRQSYEDENDIVLWVNIRDFYAARAALKGENSA